jgi:probable addiction module antidote protein
MTMAIKTRSFDPAEFIDSDEAIIEYINAALETGDAAFVADAFGVVARAKGMAAIARDAKLSRESLYKALSSEGNPELGTILKVTKALGLILMTTGEENAHRSQRGAGRHRAHPRPRRTLATA